MGEELLPCKGCGERPELVVKTVRRLMIPTKMYVIKCNKCGCAVGEKNEKKAVLNWNRTHGSLNKTEV